MSSNFEKYDELTQYKAIRAFLDDGFSHRKIQSEVVNIDAPARGGGFETMKILHKYNIDGSKKGILKEKSLREEILFATGMYKLTLELIRKYE